MGSSITLRAAKKELRSLMKQKLGSISNESIQIQSKILFDKLMGLKPYVEAQRIGVYLSMPKGEIQTDPIVRDALARGKQVFVPYIYKSQVQSPDTPNSLMDMVDIRSIAEYDGLKRDSWGIPTISPDTVSERERILDHPNPGMNGLDLILMPGVAFDIDPDTNSVRRLGHGKGFYDYFLHRYGQRIAERSISPGKQALLYGLALSEQLLTPEVGTSVPIGSHDHFLDGLLVGDGKILESEH